MVLFPNLRAGDIKRAQAALPVVDALWISGDDLRPEDFMRRLESHLSEPLSHEEVDRLRRAFTPEVEIPNSFTVRQPMDRNTEPELTSYLLDYRQEWLMKSDLELAEDARRTSRDFSVRLVNGVAGSGKSLIIVYRAKLLRQLFPNKRILVLTHNRPLIQDLEGRYHILNQGDGGVEWRTFYSWCYSLLPSSVVLPRPIGERRREDLIRSVHDEFLQDTAVSPALLEAEIDWFKDRLMTKRSEYLSADRTGRGFGLQETMRNRVFDAIQTYQERLTETGRIDWGDVPRRLWQLLEEHQIDRPPYDVILIDEAQFFAPIWIEIIKRFIAPGTGHLFIVADPTQGFLQRGQSWLSSGLEVRGRTVKLEKSYRTTRQILSFATLLYRTRIPNDDDDIVAPDMMDMPNGAIPVVVPVTSPQDETTRVVNEICELVTAGVPGKDILVLHADWEGVDRFISRLEQVLGTGVAIDPKDSGQKDRIRVCTLNAATGLESPIVFLVGLKALQDAELSLRISDEDRAELIRDNTRKIYMAITRAGQRLVMTYCGELPEWLCFDKEAEVAKSVSISAKV